MLIQIKGIRMQKIFLLIVLVIGILGLHGLESKNNNASGKGQIITNFTGANLTGANLKGVNLDGVIFCNTTMPDKTINNSGCKN